jgi:hypothetical protein
MDEGPAVRTCTQSAPRGSAPKLPFVSLPRLESVSAPAPLQRFVWPDLGLLLILLLLAGSIRFWLIAHTEVAARDGIGFVRYALQLEDQPWVEVVHTNLQHPGYPFLLMLVSWPVRFFLGGTDSLTMQLSAQITSGLAGMLLVIPMYYLGKDLFDRKAGFWGTALFQCLPVSSHVMSDALSEATFLLFCATALLLASRGLRGRSVIGFGCCGLFAGLAYLVRPEGALVLVAAGLVLVGIQVYRPWRWPLRHSLACGLSLGLGGLLAGGPYVLATGGVTNKPTPLRMLQSAGLPGRVRGGSSEVDAELPRAQASLAGGPLLASILAVYAPESPHDRRWWALQAIGMELAKGYLYVIGIPVLLGMWWFRGCLRVHPGAWVLLVLGLLHTLVLWRLAVVVGYVSDRHVLLLVLCGVFTAAAATAKIGAWLGATAYRLGAGANASVRRTAMTGSCLSVALLLAQTGFGLPESLKPLHLNRAGHRAAGRWIAEHSSPADPVEDPFCWAHFYANRVFWEGKTPPAPPGYQPTQYVVIEHSDHDHTRLPMIERAERLAASGKLVYYWPTNRPEADAKVLVYAVPPPQPKQ